MSCPAPVVECPVPVAHHRWSWSNACNRNEAGRMTTTAEGNGAEVSASPNRRRPRSRRISYFMAKACHHLVSVRAGTRQSVIE